MRRPDWEDRLHALVEAKRHAPYAYGEHDCMLWAAAVAKAITGKDHARGHRGKYKSAASASRYLRDELGADSPEALINNLLDKKPVGFAQRGDLVMDAEGIPALCMGDFALSVGQKGNVEGLVRVPREQWTKAWAVGDHHSGDLRMSEKVLAIGLTIVGVALMTIPGIGQALGLGVISIAGGTISTAVLIGLTLEIGASLLLGPGKPKGLMAGGTTPPDRLNASLIITDPRQIWFGVGNPKPQVRFQAYTGSNQEFIEQIVVLASHAVQSIDQLWLDNELAWTLSGGVQGRYASYLTVTPITVGTSSNGIGISSVWTSTCTLTGCAYVYLKFRLTGLTDKVSSPFSSGVTSRMTFRGKGAKVYDPRLDSTVAGGSGSQRADDQTTWAWDDNASRNPALQALWYELGWKINGKLAVGKGLPKARLNLASYAVAANACDESITLNGGGTEPRYRSDGSISEGDDPGAVRDHLCQTMNAVLRDSAGSLSVVVLKNDLSTPITPSGKTAFDENDVIGAMEWDQTPDLNATFNICRGRRVDPSDNALYQMVDVPEQSLTSVDGIDRIDTLDLPFVFSNGQAQRLLKQRLQRNQYQGKLHFTGGPAFWGLSLGDVFPLTHAAFGWSAKLFRCAGHKMDRSGQVEIVAVEENAAIYAWGNSEAAAVMAGAPTVYDPTNNPLVKGVGDAATTASWPSITGTGKPQDNATLGADLATNVANAKAGYVTYTDGTPVQSLQPAQAGADATAGKSVDVLTDGTNYARLPVANSYGSGLSRTALVDFTQPHSGKSLDNINDGTVYARLPAANSYGSGTSRTAMVDFTQTHLNKTLSYIADDAVYARPKANQLVNGVQLPFAWGDNLASNPGFEINETGMALNTGRTTGTVIDNWAVYENYTGTHTALVNTDGNATRSRGKNRLTLGLGAGTVPANNISVIGCKSAIKIPVKVGEVYRVRGYMFVDRTVSLPAGVNMFFDFLLRFSSDLNDTYNGQLGIGTSATGGSMTTPLMADVTVPANTTYCYMYCVMIVQNTNASPVTIDTGWGSVNFDDLEVLRRTELERPGSGVMLGDGFNAPPILSAGGRYYYSQNPSYSGATTTSATITLSAGTLVVGGQSVSYGTYTLSVSGSGTQTFYVYGDDPTYSGTLSGGLQASTDPTVKYAGTGRVYFGSLAITFTAGSSGGGGGSGCVVEESYLPGCQARDVKVGASLRLSNPGTWEERQGVVSYSERKEMPCVRFVTETGVSLKCSTTAPIGIAGGGQVLAPDLLGHSIPIIDFGGRRVEKVVSVEDIGVQWVRHITCENDFFLAGEQPNRYVHHHNIKPLG